MVQTTYKSQLETWYSTMSLVFTVTMLSSRRSLTTYTLVGTAETSNPSAVSSTSTPMLSDALASELSSALPDVTNSGVTTSVTSKLETTEEDSEEGGGGGMKTEVLIGVILGSIVIASSVGFVVHREWSRRQIPIGDKDMQEGQGQAAHSPAGLPCPYVDQIASNSPRACGAREQDNLPDDTFDLSEPASEQSFTELSITADSFDDDESQSPRSPASSPGSPSSSDELSTGFERTGDCNDKIAYLPHEVSDLKRTSSDAHLHRGASFHEAPSA